MSSFSESSKIVHLIRNVNEILDKGLQEIVVQMETKYQESIAHSEREMLNVLKRVCRSDDNDYDVIDTPPKKRQCHPPQVSKDYERLLARINILEERNMILEDTIRCMMTKIDSEKHDIVPEENINLNILEIFDDEYYNTFHDNIPLDDESVINNVAVEMSPTPLALPTASTKNEERSVSQNDKIVLIVCEDEKESFTAPSTPQREVIYVKKEQPSMPPRKPTQAKKFSFEIIDEMPEVVTTELIVEETTQKGVMPSMAQDQCRTPSELYPRGQRPAPPLRTMCQCT